MKQLPFLFLLQGLSVIVIGKYCGYTAYKNTCTPGWWWGDPVCRKKSYTAYSCCPFYYGISCKQVRCSYLNPCFPGKCDSGASEVCFCQKGFISSNCLQMQASESPHIVSALTSMIYIKRLGNVERYRAIARAGDPGKYLDYFVWLRMKDYNFFSVDFEAYYKANISSNPHYIGEFSFGIIGGKVEMILSKVQQPGQDLTVLNSTFFCPKIDINHPIKSNYNCNISQEEFVHNIEDGDILTFSAMARSGGTAQLLDESNRFTVYKNEYFIGKYAKVDMKFKFDFNKPFHCSVDSTCKANEESPLSIQKDITREPVVVACQGWKDILSDPVQATFYIFKLEPNPDSSSQTLSEVTPRFPIFQAICNMTGGICESFAYSPPETGMYSVLLEVGDKANNTEYARRLFLFDSDSNITVFRNDKNKALFVSSAVALSDYKWLSTIQDKYLDGPPIDVTWKNHFENVVLTKRMLLNSVANFPRLQYDEYSKEIYINDKVEKYDDYEGNRTVNAIVHKNGIVKVEIAYEKDSAGGKSLHEIPQETTNWENVVNYMLEKTSVNITRNSGETLRIWIKVHDVVGNTALSYTDVHVDHSKPFIAKFDLKRNIKSRNFDFASRLILDTDDEQSGISQLNWTLILNKTNTVLHSGFFTVNKTLNKNLGRIGYCIQTDECFYYMHEMEIDNCYFLMNKNITKNDIIKIQLDVYNQAMVKTSKEIIVDNLNQFDGNYYASPLEVKTSNVGNDSLTITWKKPPSCNTITEYELMYNNVEGEMQIFSIASFASSLRVQNLIPNKMYDFGLRAVYGSIISQSVPFNVTTGTIEE